MPEDTVCRTVADLRLALAELPPLMEIRTIAPPFSGIRLVREGPMKLMICPPDEPRGAGTPRK